MKMTKEHLALLEEIRDTLMEIQGLQEDLETIHQNPAAYLETMTEIRDTLMEVQGLHEDLEGMDIDPEDLAREE